MKKVTIAGHPCFLRNEENKTILLCEAPPPYGVYPFYAEIARPCLPPDGSEWIDGKRYARYIVSSPTFKLLVEGRSDREWRVVEVWKVRIRPDGCISQKRIYSV